MASAVVLLVILVFLLCIASLCHKWRQPKFPPGPIFGLLRRDHVKSCINVNKKHGDICGFNLGAGGLAVILSDPNDVRELFNRQESTGRPRYNPFIDATLESCNYGVLWSIGKPWMECRNYTFRVLRELGKCSKQSIVMFELQEILRKFGQMTDQPFQTAELFTRATFNVIWSMVASQRYDYDDAGVGEFLEFHDKFAKSLDSVRTALFTAFPGVAALKNKLPLYLRRTAGDAFREKAFEFIREEIREHECTFVPGSPRDLIDSCLEEVQRATDPSSIFYAYKQAGDTWLVFLLYDMFIAGTDTVSATLQWAFFLLALHPHVQDKVYREIRTVAPNREVVLADRQQLPYVDAMIQEILRIAAIVPLSLPHAATEDIEFKGYVIPKGTTLVANIHAAHFHRPTWGDPKNFRPERFLSSDEKTVIRHKAWMPFSVGKRQCPGASLATDEVFLFLSNLVRSVEITMPADEVEHSLEGVNSGLSYVPEPHSIVVKPREEDG